jgi:predicted CopG family antitoxin
MGRPRYYDDPTTVTVDRDVFLMLKKLKLRKGEPLGEVVRRLVKEHYTKKLVGY